MIVAVIPARGGSKRIPRKNVALLHGRPLLAYTIDAAIELLGAESVFVSTEDDEIGRVAIRLGVSVITRPADLATDDASTEAVLLHALSQPYRAMAGYHWMLTLPPTSPLRDVTTLRSFMRDVDLSSEEVDCYFSVTENRGDFWRNDPELGWSRLFPGQPRRQQDRTPLFEENSAIYLTKIEALRRTRSILGQRSIGIPISRMEGLDINDALDLSIAEALLSLDDR